MNMTLHIPKEDHEIHLVISPWDVADRQSEEVQSTHASSHSRVPTPSNHEHHNDYKFQASLPAGSMKNGSYWFIVRRNLHRIRLMRYMTCLSSDTISKPYLYLQAKRELKRVHQEIQNIDQEIHFRTVQHFALAVDKTYLKIYNTSHVKPTDALVFDHCGDEPLALQNLLYYFSPQPVSYGTAIWEFLKGVVTGLSMEERRIAQVKRSRKLALKFAIIINGGIVLMLFLMIIGVLATSIQMNDHGVE
ncbi:unnamed protein product [Rotaria sp. Silwood1]|nr:unnamed protein product [Rotaria sp. Silwood1]CAF1616210.1 unnamed protein product [Rotaria sp. Silwood1]CAF3710484.1 unnamed protein product [Rotaria sp. Silwood1]CAF3766069.1 unnamed protein product [Rotaria sp. Silwood1]CAF3783194.1 unnamed protein product [Rotaria sp. Silwood1]